MARAIPLNVLNLVRGAFALAAVALLSLAAAPAAAQDPGPERRAARLPCGAGLVRHVAPHEPIRIPAAGRVSAAVDQGQLRIEFAGHSTFLITSAGGVNVATDYNDNYRVPVLPDIAVMSGWHPNHATLNIDPAILHVLRGWHMGNGGVAHDVSVKDVRVYSIAVNINGRGFFYQFPGSIFMIQSSGLCIAHLGLVAHTLHPETVKNIGKVDVLMTPIDRVVTQSLEEIFHNIRAIDPKVVVPMHYDSEDVVEDFLAHAKQLMPVRRPGAGGFTVDTATLPKSTEVYYLVPPRFGTTL
jgi:L-ascorbate metabolism protein UlaG (beta-lactamase superfamily)